LAVSINCHKPIPFELHIPISQFADQPHDILPSVDPSISDAPLFEISLDFLGHRVVISIQPNTGTQVSNEPHPEVVVRRHVILRGSHKHGNAFVGLFGPRPLL